MFDKMKVWDIEISGLHIQSQIFRGKIFVALGVEFFLPPPKAKRKTSEALPIPIFSRVLTLKRAQKIPVISIPKVILTRSSESIGLPVIHKKINAKAASKIVIPQISKKINQYSAAKIALPQIPKEIPKKIPQSSLEKEKLEVKKTPLEEQEKKIASGVRSFFTPVQKTSTSEKKAIPQFTKITEEKIAPVQKKVGAKFSSRFQKVKSVAAESIRFVLLASILFGIGFGVTNFHALRTVIVAKVNPEAAAEKTDALENLLSEKKFAPLLPIAGAEKTDRKEFPPITISIAPLENRIVIPKIGRNVPIADIPTDAIENQDWQQLEKDIQNGLRDGVVHYPGTAEPGERGNFFVTGHSSYYLWDPGKYKDVFARLHDLEVGDEYTIFWNQNVYKYRIVERKVVPPSDTSVLDQPSNKQISTLMTCTPVGTAKDRLILVAEQIQ